MHRHVPIQIQMSTTADLPSSASPPPPSPPPPPLERPTPPHPPPDSSPAPHNHPRPPPPNYGTPIIHVPPPYPPHPEWFSLFMNFCFTAFGIFVQSNQASTSTSSHHYQLPPLSFQMACLGTVFALAAFVVSKYVPENLAAQARFPENAGVFFGLTGFLIDITPFFHLSLKIISWTVYAMSLIAIIICRNFHTVMELTKAENT